MATLTFSTIDRLNKDTSMSIAAADAVGNTAVQDIADALQAIILGAPIRAVKSVPTIVDAGSAIPPADENANRKNMWQFRFQDSVNGRIFTHTLGTADNTALPSPTTDFLDLSAGLGLAVKTALDAAYRSPYGNAGVLLSVQQVNGSGN